MGTSFASITRSPQCTLATLPVWQLYRAEIAPSPKGWQEAVLPSRDSAAVNTPPSTTDQWWRDITGRDPRECGFTLVVPIRNEAGTLPLFFKNLQTLQIPTTLPLQFIFVTNDCSDASPQLVQRFLENLGSLQKDLTPQPFSTAALDMWSMQRKNARFIHIDTQIAGKARALNLASELARALGHRIVMSLDCDTFLAPDAMALFVRDINYIRSQKPLGNFVVSATCHLEKNQNVKEPAFFRFLQQLRLPIQQQTANTDGEVQGRFMAWDSHWVLEHGGVPECAVEDYALGILIKQGGGISARSEARVWAYDASTLMDEFRQLHRFARGAGQMRRIFSDFARLEEALANNFPSSSFKDRITMRLGRVWQHPREWLLQPLKFLFMEYYFQRARFDDWKRPNDQSWPKCPSSKPVVK